MTWWCSATGQPWSWTWRPYAGVWALLVLLGWTYFRLVRRHGWDRIGKLRGWQFAGGLAALWLATDWPVGALGAGYLASVHSVQFLLLGVIAPAFLVRGVPVTVWRAGSALPGFDRLLRFLARPAPALVGFDLILLVTHVPAVVDRLMPWQAGSLLVDLAWLFGGLWLWWPVLAPPPWNRMSRPARIGYLFLATIVPTLPAAFLVFADYPIYSLYELAPRVTGLSAVEDQQIAGMVMKIAGDPIFWLAMAIVFFRWSREDEPTAA